MKTILDKKKVSKQLIKAGMAKMSLNAVTKIIITAAAILSISTYLIISFTSVFDISIANTIVYSALLIAGLLIGYTVIGTIMFYTYLDLKIFWRAKAMEKMLPDFLLLTSSNMRAGMLIDQALLYAAKPKFGFLAVEIQDMMKKVMTGKELVDALNEFTDTYDSQLMKRSFDILIEGINSGGKIASILNKIALNLSEMALQKKEMGASVTTYMIFISFASVGAAPVLMALAGQILEVMRDLLTTLSQSSDGGGMSFMAFSPPTLTSGDFMMFAIIMLGASSFFSAMIVSVIQKGNARDGIKYIPAFILISILIYLGSNAVFKSLFGAIMLG